MITVTDEFKRKVVEALLAARENWSGWDTSFSIKYGLNESVFNRIKHGEIHGLIKDPKWINLGRELNVMRDERKWNVARTEVFETIEEDINFCQQYSKARIYVDECEIGKTFAAKYISRNRKNCFYIDCSQCKTKIAFMRMLAQAIGVDHNDKYLNIVANIKYWLNCLPNPVVIVDEAGDLEYKAFLELKELWNATENSCGWYMIGADGLRHMIEKGIKGKKVGFREIFSRFSSSYSSNVPTGNQERMAFYRDLITQVLSVNMEDTSELKGIVKKCMTSLEVNKTGNNSYQLGGLRRAESILILKSKEVEEEHA